MCAYVPPMNKVADVPYTFKADFQSVKGHFEPDRNSVSSMYYCEYVVDTEKDVPVLEFIGDEYAVVFFDGRPALSLISDGKRHGTFLKGKKDVNSENYVLSTQSIDVSGMVQIQAPRGTKAVVRLCEANFSEVKDKEAKLVPFDEKSYSDYVSNVTNSRDIMIGYRVPSMKKLNDVLQESYDAWRKEYDEYVPSGSWKVEFLRSERITVPRPRDSLYKCDGDWSDGASLAQPGPATAL